jgi:hypothetical protein
MFRCYRSGFEHRKKILDSGVSWYLRRVAHGCQGGCVESQKRFLLKMLWSSLAG